MKVISILLLSLLIFACQDSTDNNNTSQATNNSGGSAGSGGSFLASNSSFHSALAKNIQNTTTSITENGSETNSVRGLVTFDNRGKIAAGGNLADTSQVELWLTNFASDYDTYFENDGTVKQDSGKDYVVLWEAAAADDLNTSLKSLNETTFNVAKVTFLAATTPKNAHTKVQIGSSLLSSGKSVVIFLRVYPPDTTLPTFSATPNGADAPLIEWRFTFTQTEEFTVLTSDKFSAMISYGADLASALAVLGAATHKSSNQAVPSTTYINFPEFKTGDTKSVVAVLGDFSLKRNSIDYPVDSIKLTGVAANPTLYKLNSVNNNSCSTSGSCVSISAIPTATSDNLAKKARVEVEIIDYYGQIYPVNRFDISFVASS